MDKKASGLVYGNDLEQKSIEENINELFCGNTNKIIEHSIAMNRIAKNEIKKIQENLGSSVPAEIHSQEDFLRFFCNFALTNWLSFNYNFVCGNLCTQPHSCKYSWPIIYSNDKIGIFVNDIFEAKIWVIDDIIHQKYSLKK